MHTLYNAIERAVGFSILILANVCCFPPNGIHIMNSATAAAGSTTLCHSYGAKDNALIQQNPNKENKCLCVLCVYEIHAYCMCVGGVNLTIVAVSHNVMRVK